MSIGDGADSEETALALSQALLLPIDMQKEIESPLSKLLGSCMVNNIKVTIIVSFVYSAPSISPTTSKLVTNSPLVQAMQKVVAISQKLDYA